MRGQSAGFRSRCEGVISGKPTDCRHKCQKVQIHNFHFELKSEMMKSYHDAQEKIDLWRTEYNSFRPHSSIADWTLDQLEERHDVKPEFYTLALS